MITRHLIEQDLELQRCAATPQELKPRFNWSDMVSSSHPAPSSRIVVQVGDEQTDLSIAKIAETVGRAVTDLALSRKQDDIFNDRNRQLVSSIVRTVTEMLTIKANTEEADGTVLLSASELTSIIEMALVRQNAHDVAKSLLIRRKTEIARRDPRGNSIEKPLCRVIRRNGEVVAWDSNKIEIAVRSAFLSLGMDSSPAKDISTALTERIARSGQEFIRIEDLQDRVQEELMRQGHYKVAESYILYRAHRANLRLQEEESHVRFDDATQESMIVVKRADGTSDLWDGSDLRRRIDFAMPGLELCLTHDQIEHELRRAFFNEMTEADLRKTIILNAKSLIERDGDFARFAARILLTYIYEEVLGWSISRDGVSRLAEFHRRAFKANLVRGIEIERLSPKLLEYNLDRLADAINPTSDPRLRLPRHPDALRPLPHHRQDRRQPPPHRGAAALLDARRDGPHGRGKGGPRGQGHRPLPPLREPPLLFLDADALQLGHAPQPAFLVLPLQGRRQHRVHHAARHRRKRLPLEVGRRSRRFVDGGARHRQLHQGHQRRKARASFPSSSCTTTSSSR